MFLRVIPNNKGKKKTYFCDLVESYRDVNGTPKHRTVVKLGQFEKERIPYLKAAFGKGDPKKIFNDEFNRS